MGPRTVFQGFIDDVRVSDIVRYTAPFLPAASPPTNGNTRALYTFTKLNITNTFADDSGNENALKPQGGARSGYSPTEECGPVISTGPQNQTVMLGEAALLTTVMAPLTPPLTNYGFVPFVPTSYQWYAGESGDSSQPIDGATTQTFMTPPLTVDAKYWARVSNPNGFANSDTAAITIIASGTAFTVNSTLDEIDASPGDGICASASSPCTLRAAVLCRGARAPPSDRIQRLIRAVMLTGGR